MLQIIAVFAADDPSDTLCILKKTMQAPGLPVTLVALVLSDLGKPAHTLGAPNNTLQGLKVPIKWSYCTWDTQIIIKSKILLNKKLM